MRRTTDLGEPLFPPYTPQHPLCTAEHNTQTAHQEKRKKNLVFLPAQFPRHLLYFFSPPFKNNLEFGRKGGVNGSGWNFFFFPSRLVGTLGLRDDEHNLYESPDPHGKVQVVEHEEEDDEEPVSPGGAAEQGLPLGVRGCKRPARGLALHARMADLVHHCHVVLLVLLVLRLLCTALLVLLLVRSTLLSKPRATCITLLLGGVGVQKVCAANLLGKKVWKCQKRVKRVKKKKWI